MNLKQLSIASFNLYNLNEPGLPMYTDTDGLDPGRVRPQDRLDRAPAPVAGRRCVRPAGDVEPGVGAARAGFRGRGGQLRPAGTTRLQRQTHRLRCPRAQGPAHRPAGVDHEVSARLRAALHRRRPSNAEHQREHPGLLPAGAALHHPAAQPRPRGACVRVPLQVQRPDPGLQREVVQGRQGALRQTRHRPGRRHLHHPAHRRGHGAAVPAVRTDEGATTRR